MWKCTGELVLVSPCPQHKVLGCCGEHQLTVCRRGRFESLWPLAMFLSSASVC